MEGVGLVRREEHRSGMGITGLYRWIVQNHPDSIATPSPRAYTHIYIDLNNVLHGTLLGVKAGGERKFVDNVCSHLDKVLGTYTALKSIVVVVDGTPPYAKVEIQKKRRLHQASHDNKCGFSRLNLTPGTLFSGRLAVDMGKYLNLQKERSKYGGASITFSSSLEPGEGEMKLTRAIIKNGEDPKATHLIIGNDADLIVIAMLHSNIRGIDVLCSGASNEGSVVKIDTLRAGFQEFCCGVGSPHVASVGRDFAALSIMMGNDYLPKLCTINMEKLCCAYKAARKRVPGKSLVLPRDFAMSTEFLRELFSEIVSNLGPGINPSSKGRCDEGDIRGYFAGVLWCLKMYGDGECTMLDYKPCTQAPPLFDISEYFDSHTGEEAGLRVPVSNVLPLLPEVCGFIILPKRSHYLLPDSYKRLSERGELSQYYEEEDCEECFRCKRVISDLRDKIVVLAKGTTERRELSSKISGASNVYATHREVHSELDISHIREVVGGYVKGMEV